MTDHADARAMAADLGVRPPAIEAQGLVKIYGETRPLDGLDLAAVTGQILAVLGPNGAGKTTAVALVGAARPAPRRCAVRLEPNRGEHRSTRSGSPTSARGGWRRRHA